MPCKFQVVELTLCYQSMVFACLQTLSLSTSFKLILFCGLLFLMGLCDNCDSIERWSLLPSIPGGHVSPFRFWNVYISKQTDFFIDVPTWNEEWKAFETLLFQFCVHFIEMCNCHRWTFISARLPFTGAPPFLIWYASCNRKGFENLMFPLWSALLGGSFVILDVGPCSLFSLFFWVLWLLYGLQGFINVWLNWLKNSNTIVWKLTVARYTQLLHWTLCCFRRVFSINGCL